MLKRIAALGLMLLAVGCGPQSRTYSVELRNVTRTPITLAITKDGPPYEASWAAPEDIMEHRPKETAGFAEVAAGHGAMLRGLTGKFDSNTHAILRVYRGDGLTVKNLLKVGVGPDRQDVILAPGDNHFEISDSQGALQIEKK
jgi:hypothetical protein